MESSAFSEFLGVRLRGRSGENKEGEKKTHDRTDFIINEPQEGADRHRFRPPLSKRGLLFVCASLRRGGGNLGEGSGALELGEQTRKQDVARSTTSGYANSRLGESRG